MQVLINNEMYRAIKTGFSYSVFKYSDSLSRYVFFGTSFYARSKVGAVKELLKRYEGLDELAAFRKDELLCCR